MSKSTLGLRPRMCVKNVSAKISDTKMKKKKKKKKHGQRGWAGS